MRTNGKTIALLGVSLDSRNMGVQALAHGAIKTVKGIFPDATLRIIDYGYQRKTYTVWTQSGTVPVDLIDLRFSKKLFLKNNVALLLVLSLVYRVSPEFIRNRLKKSNRWLREICGADLCLALSGGDSFSDIYGMRRLLYVSFPQLIVVACGIPLVQLPQTMGPFRKKLSRMLARFILRRSTRIFTRDTESLQVAEDLGPVKYGMNNVEFCYDLGFVMDVKEPESIPEILRVGGKRDVVGLNVSGLLYIGGYTRDNAFNLKIDYRKFVLKLIDHLIVDLGQKVLLIPHVMGRENHAESDWIACNEVYSQIRERYPGKIEFASAQYDQNEIKYVVGQCRCFIGSRMHSCIAALSQCTPAVAISYSRKFAGVYEILELGDLVADPRVKNGEEIVHQIDYILNNTDVTQMHLRKVIPGVEESILAKISALREFVA